MLAVAFVACALATRLFAGPDVLIDFDLGGLVQNETSLTLVPNNPGTLLTAYNNNPTGATGLGVAISSNFGSTWTTTALPMPFDPSGLVQMTSAFDPSITADGLGNAYVAEIAWQAGVGGATGLWVTQYNVASSVWGGPVNVSYDGQASGSIDPNYRLNDKVHLMADTGSGSPGVNNLYASWIKDRGLNVGPFSDIYFAASTNQNTSWSTPIIINDGGLLGSNLANGPNTAVAPDGTIYTAWLDVDVTQPQTTGTLYIDKSTNGGLTWGTDIAVQTINSVPRYLRTGLGILDARARSYPSLAVSPLNSNRLYMVYAADTILGDLDEGDIYFTLSLDGGASWSSPLLLGSAGSGDQFEPWLGVASDGTIEVAWYDRSSDPTDTLWDVFIAKSTDGGVSFTGPVKLNDFSFATPLVGGERWMGEYLGLAMDTTNAYVAFTSSLGDNLGNIYFDSIAHSNVPEPSAAVLLLLGAGCFAFRRVSKT